MKKLGQAIVVASMALLVAACGGKAFVDDSGDGGNTGDGGSGDDGGNGGDGGTCTPLPGCTSTSSCPAGDGCNQCTCLQGSWSCTEWGCPVMCPASPPPPNTFCQSDGQQCNFGPGCGPECTCDNHAWTCIEPPCPPPVCPQSPPRGTCNGEVGMSCSYGSGCNMTTCDCVATPGGPLWECMGTACVDAGH